MNHAAPAQGLSDFALKVDLWAGAVVEAEGVVEARHTLKSRYPAWVSCVRQTATMKLPDAANTVVQAFGIITGVLAASQLPQ